MASDLPYKEKDDPQNHTKDKHIHPVDVKLKEEVNTFVVDVNNNLFEINEEINLLPEEDPKFIPLVKKVDQLGWDKDTWVSEIKRIYDWWIANSERLASLEEILLSQSEELRS